MALSTTIISLLSGGV